MSDLSLWIYLTNSPKRVGWIAKLQRDSTAPEPPVWAANRFGAKRVSPKSCFQRIRNILLHVKSSIPELTVYSVRHSDYLLVAWSDNCMKHYPRLDTVHLPWANITVAPEYHLPSRGCNITGLWNLDRDVDRWHQSDIRWASHILIRAQYWYKTGSIPSFLDVTKMSSFEKKTCSAGCGTLLMLVWLLEVHPSWFVQCFLRVPALFQKVSKDGFPNQAWTKLSVPNKAIFCSS